MATKNNRYKSETRSGYEVFVAEDGYSTVNEDYIKEYVRLQDAAATRVEALKIAFPEAVEPEFEIAASQLPEGELING